MWKVFNLFVLNLFMKFAEELTICVYITIEVMFPFFTCLNKNNIVYIPFMRFEEGFQRCVFILFFDVCERIAGLYFGRVVWMNID